MPLGGTYCKRFFKFGLTSWVYNWVEEMSLWPIIS